MVELHSIFMNERRKSYQFQRLPQPFEVRVVCYVLLGFRRQMDGVCLEPLLLKCSYEECRGFGDLVGVNEHIVSLAPDDERDRVAFVEAHVYTASLQRCSCRQIRLR
jgi:hypothetical protein